MTLTVSTGGPRRPRKRQPARAATAEHRPATRRRKFTHDDLIAEPQQPTHALRRGEFAVRQPQGC